MALTDFIFRYITKAGYTTKGSELTWTELDENLEILVDELANNRSEAIGNVTPYSPTTLYTNTNPTYVSYNGNIYEYVFAGSSVGQTPDVSPAYWTLVSNGKLTHQQNTDTYLALGTANQVSASDLKSLISDAYITGTRATIIGLRDSSQLKIGRLYYISDERISLQAVSVNTLSTQGLYIGYNADYQNASTQMLQASTNDCVWGSNTSVWWTDILTTFPTSGSRIGKHCIYQGKHYTNLTGNNSATTPDSDATNWSLITPSSATYQREVDSVIYDIDLNRIMERRDKRGNIVRRIVPSNPAPIEEKFQFGNDDVFGNNVTMSCGIQSNRGQFSFNEMIGNCSYQVIQAESGAGALVRRNILNNSTLNIINQDINAVFQNNTFINTEITFSTAQSTAYVEKCSFVNIDTSSWSGLDTSLLFCSFANFSPTDFSNTTYGATWSYCKFENSAYDNTINYALTNAVFTQTKTEKDFAIVIEDTDMGINVGYIDVSKVSVNGSGTANIVDITSSQYHKPIKIQPKNPSVLAIDTNVGNIFGIDGATITYTLDGANGDYIVGVYMADNTFQITNVVLL